MFTSSSRTATANPADGTPYEPCGCFAGTSVTSHKTLRMPADQGETGRGRRPRLGMLVGPHRDGCCASGGGVSLPWGRGGRRTSRTTTSIMITAGRVTGMGKIGSSGTRTAAVGTTVLTTPTARTQARPSARATSAALSRGSQRALAVPTGLGSRRYPRDRRHRLHPGRALWRRGRAGHQPLGH